MAALNDLLQALNTKEAATSTDDLAKELAASREGTRKQLKRLRDKGYVEGDSQEGWLITDDGKKELDRGGVHPSMLDEGVSPRDKFEAIGRLIGISQDRIVLATDMVFKGDYNDIKYVWETLGEAGIRDDLRRIWVNYWRHDLEQGIPPELESVLVIPEHKKEGVTETGVKAEEGRSYILRDDLPVYVGKDLGDLSYVDALDLAKVRAARAARSVQGASSQQSSADDIIKIVNAVREWGGQSGQAAPKSYMVTQGEEGAIVQEVEPGKPVVLSAPQASKPAATFFVDGAGNVTQAQPGEPVVIRQQSATPQTKTFIVRQTSEGIVAEEHELGKPIIINNPAPGASMTPMYPFPAMGADGKPIVGQDGKPVYVDIEPMMKWMGFQQEQRRADERHSTLMGLAQTIKENLPIGVEAFQRAVSEVKGESAESTAQPYECGECHRKFTLPRLPAEGEKVECPNCHHQWPGEEIMSP